MSEPRVSVVVTSFNRPAMLRQCLMSVAAARPYEVFIADDGSDCLTADGRPFSVAKVAAFALYGRVKYGIVANDPITAQERMTTPRQGALINEAFSYCEGDIYTLVCDDDLIAPGWFDALRAHWREFPQRELVRGDWLQFEDGETASVGDAPCALDGRGMTAGNFAWHASLTRDRGALWSTTHLNCLDNEFLNALQMRGVSQFRAPHIGALAGWRRSHALANGNYATGTGHHTAAFEDVLRAGRLEG